MNVLSTFSDLEYLMFVLCLNYPVFYFHVDFCSFLCRWSEGGERVCGPSLHLCW